MKTLVPRIVCDGCRQTIGSSRCYTLSFSQQGFPASQSRDLCHSCLVAALDGPPSLEYDTCETAFMSEEQLKIGAAQ